VTVRSDLEVQLERLPGLERRRSRFGDQFSFFAGPREIAHFHGDGRMDVRLTRDVIRVRKAEGGLDERVQTRGPSADWAAVRIETVRDIPLAVSLVEEAIRANGGGTTGSAAAETPSRTAVPRVRSGPRVAKGGRGRRRTPGDPP